MQSFSYSLNVHSFIHSSSQRGYAGLLSRPLRIILRPLHTSWYFTVSSNKPKRSKVWLSFCFKIGSFYTRLYRSCYVRHGVTVMSWSHRYVMESPLCHVHLSLNTLQCPRINNGFRSRLGETFSYIYCIFVYPNLDLKPLFTVIRANARKVYLLQNRCRVQNERTQKLRGFWEIGIHYYYNYIIKRQHHAKAVFDNSTTTIFEKVKKKYAICIICVSLTHFPEPSSVLASMFYHFEPDNDFAILNTRVYAVGMCKYACLLYAYICAHIFSCFTVLY
jgi:hypothetical protein